MYSRQCLNPIVSRNQYIQTIVFIQHMLNIDQPIHRAVLHRHLHISVHCVAHSTLPLHYSLCKPINYVKRSFPQLISKGFGNNLLVRLLQFTRKQSMKCSFSLNKIVTLLVKLIFYAFLFNFLKEN